MRKLGLVIPCILTFALTLFAQPARPDFSGSWILVPARGSLQVPVPSSRVFVIEHREPAFRMVRISVTDGETDEFSIDPRTDGSETSKSEPGSVAPALMHWDGSRLVYQTVILTNNRTASGIARYELADDGNSLTARESFRGPVLKVDDVWVFEKSKGGRKPL
jgi:hypothetical protein